MRNGAFKALVACIVLGLIFTSCGYPMVNLGKGPHNIDADDYKTVLDTWTRTIRVLPLDGLENILTADVTYLSHEFRYAYTSRVSHDLNLSSADKDKLKNEQLSATGAGHEFFISLMTGVKNCDKLDPEDGVWTIRLRDDTGREVAPIEVTKIDKPTPNEVKYFSFDAIYRTAYRIVFPLTGKDGAPILSNHTKHFDLSFATAYGKGTARWESRPGRY